MGKVLLRTSTTVQLLPREVSEVLLRVGEKTLPTRSLRKRRAVSDRGSVHRSLCPWNSDIIRLEATVYGQTRKETRSQIVKDFICYMRPLENVLLLIPRGSLVYNKIILLRVYRQLLALAKQ